MALTDDVRPLADEARPLPDAAPAAVRDLPLGADVPSGSMTKAVIAGCVAALIGALVWGGIAKATEMEIGWIAIGIGFLCGIAVRAFGKGESSPFRVVAALTSVGGIALGKVLAILWFLQGEHPDITVAQAAQILPQTLSPIDALFVAIAVWQAWKVAVPASE